MTIPFNVQLVLIFEANRFFIAENRWEGKCIKTEATFPSASEYPTMDKVKGQFGPGSD